MQDVLVYLTQPEAWEGDELDRLRVMSAISQALLGISMCEDDDMPIGTISMFATALAPENWLICDGTEYNRVDYPELFALLDPNYQLGPDTFVTPDMRGLFAMGGSHDDFPIASTGGSYSETLDTDKMPFHQHTTAPHNHPIDKAVSTELLYQVGATSIQVAQVESGNTGDSGYLTDFGQGGSAPHNNTPPYRVLVFAIRAR